MKKLKFKLKRKLNNSQSHTGQSFQGLEARSQEEEFWKFYRDRELTNCLDFLEQLGFSGDLAVFVLALVGGGR